MDLDPFDEIHLQPIHIRLRQRTARKSTTTVEGLSVDIDLPELVGRWRKQFCCRATLCDDTTLGPVVEMSGDQRQNVVRDLLEEGLAEREQLYVHGT